MLNSLFHHLGKGGKSGFVTAAVASKCVVGLMGSDRNFEQAEGFLGSDPNSGQCLRTGQERFTDLGSDPNNPGSFSPYAPSAVASNCVVLIDRNVFVFILAPLSHPRLSLAPPGEREAPTAIWACI